MKTKIKAWAVAVKKYKPITPVYFDKEAMSGRFNIYKNYWDAKRGLETQIPKAIQHLYKITQCEIIFKTNPQTGGK